MPWLLYVKSLSDMLTVGKTVIFGKMVIVIQKRRRLDVNCNVAKSLVRRGRCVGGSNGYLKVWRRWMLSRTLVSECVCSGDYLLQWESFHLTYSGSGQELPHLFFFFVKTRMHGV